jgi:hypothetical protein
MTASRSGEVDGAVRTPEVDDTSEDSLRCRVLTWTTGLHFIEQKSSEWDDQLEVPTRGLLGLQIHTGFPY